jgi:hypothetical protein
LEAIECQPALGAVVGRCSAFPVNKNEEYETENAALHTFSRERCDKAVVPSFGDMRAGENVLEC